MHLRELALALLLAGCAEAGFYSGGKSAVLELDGKNFAREILDSKNAAIVEFYAPWCGHCKNLKPAYEKAAESLRGIAKVAAIDCDEEKNKRTCGEYGVEGFPSLKIFKPSGKKGKPTVEDYNGARTAKGISDALAERIPNHVTKVTADKLDTFLSSKNETAKAILFTNKGATAALWKSLAVDFLDGIVFAQIRDKEKSAVKAFGVEKFPTIVLLPGGKIEGKVYQGKMEKAALSEFFGGVVPVKSSKEAKAEKKAASSSSKAENESSSTAEQPKATEKPKAEVLPVAALADVQTLCLAKKSKTCILSVGDSPLAGVSEVYAKLTSRPPPHTFQVYNVEASGALGKELVEKLALGRLPKLVAVNHRGWYRLFSGDAEKPEQVLAWLDAIKMGEGKKEKIPASLLKEAEKAEKKTEAKKAEKKTEEEIVEEKEGKAEKAEETLSAKLGEPKVEDTSEERFEERFDIKDEL